MRINYGGALVTNKAPEESKSKLSSFKFNLEKAKIRYEKLEGRQHLVVPMVMLTEGVHNGSRGPVRYTREEIEKFPAAWNAKPVVVCHPTKNGRGISACDPTVFNSSKIGLIMNTSVGDTTIERDGKKIEVAKLASEAWIDVEKANKVDDRIIKNVEEGKVTELSTGLFSEDVPAKEGSIWNGEAYSCTATNIRPDHLAILPDDVGACSVKDGAGLLRNMSHDELRDGVQKALEAKHGKYEASIESMHDDGVVHRGGSGLGYGKLFHQKYKVGDKGVELDGDPKEVTKKTSYMDSKGACVANVEGPDELDAWKTEDTKSLADADKTQEQAFEDAAKKIQKKKSVTKTSTDHADLLKKPVAGGSPPASNSQKEKPMLRAAMISLLITNAAWSQSKDLVEKMSDEQLKLITDNLKTNEETDVTTDTEEELEQEGNKTGVDASGKKKPPVKKKPEDFAGSNNAAAPALTASQQEALEYGEKTMAQNRSRMISTITSNKRFSKFSQKDLSAMKFPELERLAEAAAPEPTANYGGMADAFAPSSGPTTNEEFKLSLPKMDFTKSD